VLLCYAYRYIEVSVFGSQNGVSHESQGGDGVHGISDTSTVPREDVISSTKGLVARLKSASDGSVERRTSIGTTHEDVTEDFDLPTDDILFNLDKVPQKKDKVGMFVCREWAYLGCRCAKDCLLAAHRR
jgi:hypothetical protein